MNDKPRVTVQRDELGRVIVTSTADLELALGAGYGPNQIAMAAPDTTADIADALAAAETRFSAEREDWNAERARLVNAAIDGTLSEQRDAIQVAERIRIREIQSLTKPGLQGVADEAIEQGTSVEAFALAQLRAINDRGITLEAILRDSPESAPHAPPVDETESKARARSSWDRVVTRFSEPGKKG